MCPDLTLKADHLKTSVVSRLVSHVSSVSIGKLSDIPVVHRDLVAWTGTSWDHLAAPFHFHGAAKCQRLPGQILFILYYSLLKKTLSIKKAANVMSKVLAVLRAALVPTFSTTESPQFYHFAYKEHN